MIVDDLRTVAHSARAERSARLRWTDGEARLWVRAPAYALAGAADASAFLAAALPLAMLRGEDLEIDGEVSPRLLARAERITSVYSCWNPGLRRAAVRAAALESTALAGAATAAFFSRGVDASYSATAPRPGEPPLDALVFADGLDLRHDPRVRAAEIRLAREAAAAIGLPLLVVATNVRRLSEPLCDWEDMVGAGLAFLALSLSGAVRRAVIPSSDTVASIVPCGTSPLLDPLFSTEAVEISHDALERTRQGKVAWIAEHAPALLPYLKVCYAENRPDNCGRCGKCMVTMAALIAAGALDRASGFPDRLDLEALSAIRLDATLPAERYELAEAARALDPEGEAGRLRAALLDRLADRGRWVDPATPPPSPGSFRLRHGRRLLGLIRDGRPYPHVDGAGGRARDGASSSLGLVKALDPSGNRHVYALGARPAGRVVAELGSLRDAEGRPAEGIAAWLTDDGRLLTDAYRPAPPRPDRALVARWTLAPLSWWGFRTPATRTRTALARARRLLLGPRRLAPPSLPGREPDAYLYAEPRADRLALYAAVHPVTGDQLLCAAESEAGEMGYVGTERLGYIDAVAPVTGRLGAVDSPALVWASRLGWTGAARLKRSVAPTATWAR